MNTNKIYAEHIANEYAPKQTPKVRALKRLDAKAKNQANIFSFSFGIISSLIIEWHSINDEIRYVIGCLGLFGVSINYPLYKKIHTLSLT